MNISNTILRDTEYANGSQPIFDDFSKYISNEVILQYGNFDLEIESPVSTTEPLFGNQIKKAKNAILEILK